METVGIGSQIVEIFTGTFEGLTAGLTGSLVKAFDALLINSEGGLTNLAIWGIVFGAMSLGIFLVKKLTRKVG